MSNHYDDSLRIYNKYRDEAISAEETHDRIVQFLLLALRIYQEQRKGMH